MNFSRCMQMFSRYRAVGRLAVTVAYMKGWDDFQFESRQKESWNCGFCFEESYFAYFENSLAKKHKRDQEKKEEEQAMAYLENLEREKMEKIQKEFEYYCQLQQIVNEAEKYDSSYNLGYLKDLIKLKSKYIGKEIEEPTTVPTIEKQDRNMKFFSKLIINGKRTTDRNTISLVSEALELDAAKNDKEEARSVVMRHQNDSIGALHILISHPEDMMELIPELNDCIFQPNIRKYLKEYEREKESEAPEKKKEVKDKEKEARVQAAKEWFREEENREYRRRNINNELLLLNYLRLQMRQQIQNHNFHTIHEGRTGRFSISFQVKTASGETRTLRICLRCADGKGKAIVWTSAKDEKGNPVNMEAFEIITAYLE
ncbi:unnamed protein product [Caenorhabditis brenneri]